MCGHCIHHTLPILLQHPGCAHISFHVVHDVVHHYGHLPGNITNQVDGRLFLAEALGQGSAHSIDPGPVGGRKCFHWRRRCTSVVVLISLIFLELSVQHRNANTQPVSKGGCATSADGTARDDNSIVVVGDGVNDVLQEERAGSQVVHPAGKERLTLLRMEVDGDDVVEASLDAHVRHQLEADVPASAVGKRGTQIEGIYQQRHALGSY